MADTTIDGRTGKELVVVQAGLVEDADPLQRVQMLPCRLVLEVPVVDFTVGTLMRLEYGSIVETAAQHNEDLLLHVNGQIVGAVKFDVTGERLAVRLTGVA
jgi:flagellar motor switch/type III secretory pathway protein FliN